MMEEEFDVFVIYDETMASDYAETCGIDANGINKWMTLIQNSVERDRK